MTKERQASHKGLAKTTFCVTWPDYVVILLVWITYCCTDILSLRFEKMEKKNIVNILKSL